MQYPLTKRFLTAALCVVFMLVGLSAAAADELPPRPEPEVTEISADGGLIKLQLGADTTARWTEVEWLAGDGNWYLVDGWRGWSDDGQVVWWVARENLGETNFRWIVYTAEGDSTPFATSDPFDLPLNQQQISVNLTLD